MSLDNLLGNPNEDSEEKEAVIRFAKKNFPWLMYDRVPIEFDSNGSIKNKGLASSLWGWQRDVIYNLNPKETPIVISHLTNGSGKTYVVALSLSLLLIDDHPALSPGFMGVSGEFWLLSNPSLLKTQYPSAFIKGDPGFLGDLEVYKQQGYYDITNSRGEVHRIKLIKDSTSEIVGFENTTNGKSIRFWSYSVNEQKLAGHNPLSIFCDEFGDKTLTSQASGANKLTWEKFEEMSVRCGRNYKTGDNWVFCLFFTLTLGEAWIEDLIDLAKDGKVIDPELNKIRGLPDDHQCVHLIKGTSSKDNPYINKSTLSVAMAIGRALGKEQNLERRLISTDTDDPNLVFPRSYRPKKLSPEESQQLIHRARTEPGWALIESIDPGWADKCSVLFSLCHPIHGIYVLHEFYTSGYTVPKVAAVVKKIEQEYFGGIKVAKRLYDPHHIRKTTQENPVPNYHSWRDAGLPGDAAYWSKDRSYNNLFELIINDLLKYYSFNCTGLDKELRVHRKDQNGIPEDKKNNHSIDALRHICNWYYEEYAKKIHLANPTPEIELSPARKAYYAQLEYYNKFIKPKETSERKILGVPISKLRGIKKPKGY